MFVALQPLSISQSHSFHFHLITTMSSSATASNTPYVKAGSEEPVVVVPGTVVSDGAVAGSSAGGMRPKEGHVCCGGCCDVRRAVIVVNLITLGFNLLGIFSILAMANIDPEQYDDDEVKEAFASGVQNTGLAIGLMVGRMVGAGCGVYGAYKFNIWLVGFSLLLYVLDFAMAAVALSIGGLLLAGFFAYPHVFFIMEVRNGIMTPANYEEAEKQSCCCV